MSFSSQNKTLFFYRHEDESVQFGTKIKDYDISDVDFL